MRLILAMLMVSGMAWGQGAEQAKPEPAPPGQEQSAAAAQVAPAVDPHSVVIPAGTKVPLTLKQAISTKNAREGDPVYAETAFPFVANDRMLIPAGTYIQGKISRVDRAKRGLKGGAGC